MEDIIKVLVVDDDRRMVKTICDILRIKGFEATAAYTGEEAIERVESCKIDCVLMDIKIPRAGEISPFSRRVSVEHDFGKGSRFSFVPPVGQAPG